MTVNGVTGTLQGVPVVNDPQPFYGSQFDTTATDREPQRRQGLENYANGNISENLTFASAAAHLGRSRRRPRRCRRIARPRPICPTSAGTSRSCSPRNGQPVNWRWYEEGYDHEPNDPAGETTHAGYVSHHNGAQYFGYIANNPALAANLRGLGDAFADLRGQQAAAAGRRVLHPRRLRQHRRP